VVVAAAAAAAAAVVVVAAAAAAVVVTHCICEDIYSLFSHWLCDPHPFFPMTWSLPALAFYVIVCFAPEKEGFRNSASALFQNYYFRLVKAGYQSCCLMMWIRRFVSFLLLLWSQH
jgi:hypothetical protein